MRNILVPALLVASTFSAQADTGVAPPAAAPEAVAPAALAAEAPKSAPEAAPTPAPPPYMLPWQLRPSMPVNVVRIEDAIASHAKGLTSAGFLFGSYKVRPDLAVFLRLGGVFDFPDAGDSRASFVNPAVGVSWGLVPHPDLKIALSFTSTVPVGMGGGDTPDKDAQAADRAGVLARSAMDNAMFSVNDLTLIPGFDIAYVKNGLVLQFEATVLELLRVRGAADQKDSAKTNFTSGIFAAYFVHPQVSVGGELRYQRWLTTPVAVSKDENLRDNVTAALGVRGHFKAGSYTLRPGVSFGAGLHGPASVNTYRIVQLDLPVNF